MSILNFGFTSPGEFKKHIKAAAPLMEKYLEDAGLIDAEWVKLLKSDCAPKDIFGLDDGEMDALFQFGYQALEGGDFKSAELVFSKLCQLDSLDARFHFAMGATLQLQGHFGPAAKLYLIALSLKATWVDIYIRLGECLLAAGEFEQADGVLSVAEVLIDEGFGSEALKAQLERLLVRASGGLGART